MQGGRIEADADDDAEPEFRRVGVFLEDGKGGGGAAGRRLQGHAL